MKKYIFYTLLVSLLFGVNLVSFAQNGIDCAQVLDQEPYFSKHQTLQNDALFLRDLEILKHCGNYGSVDSLLLKGSVLSAFLRTAMDEGQPATYRTMIGFMDKFKGTQDYLQFVESLKLYKSLENRKVNLEEWDLAQPFFVKMGFTQNDIDDFKQFIAEPAHHELTYIAAYYLYMKELNEVTGSK
ncbi:hypothetical protein AY601_4652 [Pedobacter cryoconitis]|uniref:Uncharacterized protein n=1 Tax=Pedobacter cryoconitis TaxID=188932 RepID=A0A127VJI7_9SPHI|nr:hypothetical protein [Pedobacter cryoconitis]AMQ01485.1 hypothetical protein AY601_4652 [Pedobacter cryoconitis]